MLFDRLEKHPLTEKQRQACLSDAQTTLVLAGAGTGKTSTLMGRIVYLWETQQARPEEVLSLAFAVDAAQEVQQRVEQAAKYHLSMDVSLFKARTFHSLGWHIVQTVEQKSPKLSAYCEESALQHFLHTQFSHLVREDINYRWWLFWYFTFYEQHHEQALEEEAGALSCHDNNPALWRSLNDDYVVTTTELFIANLLYLLKIPYIYRAHYINDIYPDGDYQPYQCSFYLPQSHCYIEVVKDVATIENKQSFFIGRSIFSQDAVASMHGLNALEKEEETTKPRGIFIVEGWERTFSPKSIRIYEQDLSVPFSHSPGRLDNLLNLLQKLFLTVRAKGESASVLQETLPQRKMSRQTVLYALLEPLLSRYEQALSHAQELDFDDMIVKAKRYIQQGDFVVPWKEVLIDEFQDISLARMQLIQAMRSQNPTLRLFCVGDDWQTIYQFAGSELRFIRYIEQYLGPSYKISLDTTFRFHQGICRVSSEFVQRNPLQYRKDLSSLNAEEEGLVLVAYETGEEVKREGQNAWNNTIAFRPPRQRQEIESAVRYIVSDITDSLNRQGSSLLASQNVKISCLLLARFRHHLPEVEQLQMWQKTYPLISFRTATIHASKGTEADFVIVLNVDQGEYGLPSEKTEECVIENVTQETFPHAQERRVFYVAITRAKKRVYLCYHKENPSVFLSELQQYQKMRQLITTHQQPLMLKWKSFVRQKLLHWKNFLGAY